MADGRDARPPVPLVDLVTRFGLGDRDLDVLLVALAPEIDPEVLGLASRANDGLLFRGVDLELVLGLLFATPAGRFDGRDLLGPDAPLVRHGLVRLVPVGADSAPLDVEVRLAAPVANFVLERPLLTGVLAEYCTLLRPSHAWDDVIVPDDVKRAVWGLVSGSETLRDRLARWGYEGVLQSGSGLNLLFAGPPGTGKTAFAHAIAHRLDRPMFAVHVSRLLQSQAPLQPILADLFRTASLAHGVVLLDDCEGLLGERSGPFHALLDVLGGHDAVVILATNDPTRIDFAVARRLQYRVDFEVPTSAAREQIWEVHLPPDAPLDDDIDLPLLASLYEFTGAAIRNTVLVALARLVSDGAPKLDMGRLRAAAETQLRARFDAFAVRSAGRFDLSRLVLPDEERMRLNEILVACRYHSDVLTRWGFSKRLATGRGVCVLFDGPPGTGKSFAAEIMSTELSLPLYRVHIPNVVSKWVGETERNIAEIFSRARASRAILLFDEADSLFGRRTSNATTANDRFANMEVNLLLQEVERYDGISVLTTNLYGNLDEALQRRIQFRVTFPFPSPDERARIWQALMPDETPVGADVDFVELGRRFELAGGHIKNALLRAAYAAFGEGTAVHRRHLVDAAIAESRARGQAVREAPPPKIAAGSRP